jgi:hypothetical protein
MRRIALSLCTKVWANRFAGITLGLKLTIILVGFGFAFSGRPPAIAQEQYPSIEDTKQDKDIAYLQGDLGTHVVLLTTLQARVNQQGEDIARLDTKLTMLGAFIAFLQSAGIGITFITRKKSL